MQDIRDFRKGELTLGISTSRGAVMLPKILPEFRSAFPQIKLNLVEGTTKEINQALFEGQADLCIGLRSMIQKKYTRNCSIQNLSSALFQTHFCRAI